MIPWSCHNFMMKALSKLFLAKSRGNYFQSKKSRKAQDKVKREEMLKQTLSRKELKISSKNHVIKFSAAQSIQIFCIEKLSCCLNR